MVFCGGDVACSVFNAGPCIPSLWSCSIISSCMAPVPSQHCWRVSTWIVSKYCGSGGLRDVRVLAVRPCRQSASEAWYLLCPGDFHPEADLPRLELLLLLC